MRRHLIRLLCAVLCLVSVLGAAAAEGATYADTIAWDGAYDVVVIGFGGAGAVSASTAADNGARVLLVEKAPEGHEGGNTRYCGQLFAYGHEDEEATLAYYKALSGTHDVPEEMLKVYTTQIAHMYDVVADLFGADKTGFMDYPSDYPFVGPMSPEYPEFPGADKISLNTMHEGFGDAYLWQNMRKLVTDRSESIDVWFESPAVHLIQEPATRTIIGVEIEREGETVKIRANNGVVLACGGFENNADMVECYLGITTSAPYGTVYNTGDGVRMAAEVGADFWHMDVYESAGAYGTAAFMTEDGERAAPLGADFQSGSVIYVGTDGSRLLREDAASRHGHIYQNGDWLNPPVSQHNYVVYDQKKADALAASGAIAEAFQGQVVSADTLEALAEKTGMNADVLKKTVENYNMFAETGVDYQYGRAAETMTAFDADGPYYAYEVRHIIFNTQGGPRKNEKAEVLDGFGNPIPHLYEAGELGGICSFQYQGGGNIAETIIFGQIAGKNAAAPKEALPELDATVKTNTMRFTPGAVSDVNNDSAQIETAENEYVGVSHHAMGGDLTVKVCVKDGVIASVEVIDQKETEGIGTLAIEALPQAIVDANSTQVDTVASATITSKAILEAVDDALSQVK